MIELEGDLPSRLRKFGRLFTCWDDMRDAIQVDTPARLAGALRGIDWASSIAAT